MPPADSEAEHRRLIAFYTAQLRADLPSWERDEIIDTIAMHRAALYN